MKRKQTGEQTFFALPKRCAQAVAEAFGRRLDAIVLVSNNGYIQYTDTFPCTLDVRPGEQRIRLNYPPRPAEAVKP